MNARQPFTYSAYEDYFAYEMQSALSKPDDGGDRWRPVATDVAPAIAVTRLLSGAAQVGVEPLHAHPATFDDTAKWAHLGEHVQAIAGSGPPR